MKSVTPSDANSNTAKTTETRLSCLLRRICPSPEACLTPPSSPDAIQDPMFVERKPFLAAGSRQAR